MSNLQMSNSTSDMSPLKTVGVAAAGTFLGISAMLLMQNQSKANDKAAKNERIKQRKNRYLEKKAMQEFVNDARKNAADVNTDKPKRRVHLYFDENDEMVERSEEEDQRKEMEAKALKSGKADPNLDID